MPLNASHCLSVPLNASQRFRRKCLRETLGKAWGASCCSRSRRESPKNTRWKTGEPLCLSMPLIASQCLSAIPAEMLDFTQIPRLPPARRAGLPLGTCVGLRGRRPLWRSGSVPSALLPLPGGNWGNAAPWGGPTGRRQPKGRNPEGRRPASRGTPPRPRARVRPPGARAGPRAAAYGVLGIKVLLLPLPPAGG